MTDTTPDQEIEIQRLRCLVWVLMDKRPCRVVNHKCQTHGFVSGFASILCPHATAKYVLPDDFGVSDFGADDLGVADFGAWVAERGSEARNRDESQSQQARPGGG